MYWKIVRINGDGSLRLIYNGVSTTPSNEDLVNSHAIGMAPFNKKVDDPKYTGYTYDNGTDSFVKREVDTWYKNTLGSSGYDSSVIEGKFCSDSSGYKSSNEYDLPASSSCTYSAYGERLGGRLKNTPTDNKPTLMCPETDETYGGSYRLKAGLITADELVLAGENAFVQGNGYLNTSLYPYWTMTPGQIYRCQFAYVFEEYNIILHLNGVTDMFAVRPVINVIADNGFTSGDGTSSNPYVIK